MCRFALAVVYLCSAVAVAAFSPTPPPDPVASEVSLYKCASAPDLVNGSAPVLPPSVPSHVAFMAGVAAGIGEGDPFLCATGPLRSIAVAVALYDNFQTDCEDCDPTFPQNCGRCFFDLYFAAFATPFLVIDPASECHLATFAIAKLQESLHQLSNATMTAAKLELLLLAGVEDRHRLSLIRQNLKDHPFCAGYQASVFLTRLVEEPMEPTEAEVSSFVHGFADGLTLSTDDKCLGTLRLLNPQMLQEIQHGHVMRLLGNLFDTFFECLVDYYFVTNVETSNFKHPGWLKDSLKQVAEHRGTNLLLELASAVRAASIGSWQRSGEELGKAVFQLLSMRRTLTLVSSSVVSV